MPTVEKVAGGRVLVRGIGRFEIGDRADVSADDAAYLCEERGDFERVVPVETVGALSEDEWLDVVYEERASRVLDGWVDDDLDTVEKVETSQAVIDAVEERRVELEAGEGADADADGDDGDDDGGDDAEICGAELSDGGTCDRPADECPYHGDDEDDTEA